MEEGKEKLICNGYHLLIKWNKFLPTSICVCVLSTQREERGQRWYFNNKWWFFEFAIWFSCQKFPFSQHSISLNDPLNNMSHFFLFFFFYTVFRFYSWSSFWLFFFSFACMLYIIIFLIEIHQTNFHHHHSVNPSEYKNHVRNVNRIINWIKRNQETKEVRILIQ